jgi:hypothetical protein
MRGHGFTNVGKTIEEAVFRAVFTCKNAQIQTTSLLLLGSLNRSTCTRSDTEQQARRPVVGEGIRYLSEREVGDSWTQMQGTVERPWGLWCEEVRRVGLYQNLVRDELEG